MPSPRQDQRPESPEHKQPDGMNIWAQLAIAAFIFLAISAGYSFIREYIAQQEETIPLSQVATDISAGKIAELQVSGDSVRAFYYPVATTSATSTATPATRWWTRSAVSTRGSAASSPS
jgi:hypothetical protein